jgi:hypothetical protein
LADRPQLTKAAILIGATSYIKQLEQEREKLLAENRLFRNTLVTEAVDEDKASLSVLRDKLCYLSMNGLAAYDQGPGDYTILDAGDSTSRRTQGNEVGE